MNKNSTKGFTLIELLAVIVILVIIALITVPIVLLIVSNIQKKADERSVANYLHAIELTLASKNTEEDFRPQECIVEEDGNLDCNGVKVTVKSKGNHPDSGFVTIKEWSVSEYKLYLRGKEYSNLKYTPSGCFEVEERAEYTYKVDYDTCIEDKEYIDSNYGEGVAEKWCRGESVDGYGTYIEYAENQGWSLKELPFLTREKIPGTEDGTGIITEYTCAGVKEIIPESLTEENQDQELGEYSNVVIPQYLPKNKLINISINQNKCANVLLMLQDDLSEEEIKTNCQNFSQEFETYSLNKKFEVSQTFERYGGIVDKEYEKGDNLEITEIGMGAFELREIQSVSLPNSITAIGESAFARSNLSSINLPNGITKIEDGTFNRTNLRNIKIPDHVTKIGNYAFDNNNLTKLTIPDSVKEIGRYAFSNNELSNVSIPEEVEIIGDYAFSSNNLKNITIPKMVKEIRNFAFQDNQLEEVIFLGNVEIIGSGAFNRNLLTDIKIPEGVKVIERFSFQSNNLKSITLPDNLTSIGDYAFEYNQLTNITLPDSLTYIGAWAFDYNYLEGVTIPKNVSQIDYKAFNSNPLKKVTIYALKDRIKFKDSPFGNFDTSKIEWLGETE